MKMQLLNMKMAAALIFSLAVAAAPGFAQGLGVDVGLAGQTSVGLGGGAGLGAATSGVQNTAGAAAGAGLGVAVQSELPSTRADAGIASRIESNPQLAARVESLLPSGISMASASSGFKNEAQFISALHASHNLDIPFDQLKTKMTGSNSMSLGSAIHASKSSLTENQVKEETKKAESQAKATASGKADASVKADAAAGRSKSTDKQ